MCSIVRRPAARERQSAIASSRPGDDGERPRRDPPPLAVGALATALAVVFVVLRLAAFDGDVSRFVLAGDAFTDPGRAPSSLHVLRGSTGYDGQFYLRLALAPLDERERVHGISFPNDGYFRQRPGYPLAVAAVGWGDPSRTIAGMVAVNVAAFGAVAALGAALARRYGRTTWLGVAVVAWPGFWITLGRDLTELVAMTFVLAAVLSLERRAWPLATAMLTLAVLTRETTLLLALAVGVAAVVRRSPPRYVAAVPVAAFAALQLALLARWGDLPIREGTRPSPGDPPFAGMIDGLRRLAGDGADAVIPFLAVAALVVFVGAVVLALRTTTAAAYLRWAFVAYAVLAATIPTLIWRHDSNFLRATTELYVLGLFILLAAPRVVPGRAAAVLAVLSLGTAATHITVP